MEAGDVGGDGVVPELPTDAGLRDFRSLAQSLPRGWSVLDDPTPISSNDVRTAFWSSLDRIVSEDGHSRYLPEDVYLREQYRRICYWVPALMGTLHSLLWQVATVGGVRLLPRAATELAARLLRLGGIEIRAGLLAREDYRGFGISVAGPSAVLGPLFGSGIGALQSAPLLRLPWVRMPPLRWPSDVPIPIAVEERPRLDPHGIDLGFGGGRAASYATYSAEEPGIGQLGCKHVLDEPVLGQDVHLAHGGMGRVVALGRDGIDLAVVSDPSRTLSADDLPDLRRTQLWPAPSMPCELEGKHPVRTRVHYVENQYGVFNDPMLPVHVDLENHGEPGDSGSAAIDETTGGILGVYRGSIPNKGPIVPGRCVHIQQAIQLMSVTLIN